ncbi:GtrA family protein [Bradyrhizobium sp. JYMT SZCCT0428]|uniref:GtrA family protein n=1 Tax=Bradyrhizobium sp. JYMT SZCCT0428 TaxID=2807673 RepID=UPI001BAD54B1|nr:GtrA family protein [Bradyrhizobium sp. JYMT SZCCT0428]MBR1157398.1 GtrA family protein [Bradyrhizobium sp. JYMT SZCCT0428]
MQAFARQIIDAWNRRSFLAKLFSFASIGVVNVLVDVSAFTFFVQVVHLQLIPSNILAWIVAVTGSYMMNSKITFGHETGGLLSVGRYLRFAASGILGVVIATTVLVVLSRYTTIPIAKLASIASAFSMNFCMSHFFVFRAQPAARARAPLGTDRAG